MILPMGLSASAVANTRLTLLAGLSAMPTFRIWTVDSLLPENGFSATSILICTAKAGHGNDRMWKGWKAMMPASHPSHTLWKSLRDYHIPTASTRRSVFRSNDKSSLKTQLKVSPPRRPRNECPPIEHLLSPAEGSGDGDFAATSVGVRPQKFFTAAAR
jgi:hypothetical protein